jgi:cation diffusion facilitator CzcD-associated flavoprotein CzcO
MTKMTSVRDRYLNFYSGFGSMEDLPDLVPVVIIGAGFSGIAMGAQIKRKFKIDNFIIYDRSAHIGGTWYTSQCELQSAHIST